ncbi:prenyltransferase/squalene oxidase repeat-containing protein [Embleya sp. NPDC050154]|uniref:prenyltransferase/squalene oxidase repeat-containing protein n=1 Tax=Embleya sp. NPDC050154 TaxID=3363988 RepID=UPI0037A02030
MPSPRRRGRAAAASVLTTTLLCSLWTGGVAAAAPTPPPPGGSLGAAVGDSVPRTITTSVSAVQRVSVDKAQSGPVPLALYGRSDPTSDGVYRQSLAIMALASTDSQPAPTAIEWLLGQQCADGGFTAYRADPAAPCDAARENTVATATAIEALHALRTYDTRVARGVDWLRSKQLADGSFATAPAPDATGDPAATAAAISAIVTAGRSPELLRSPQGRTPTDALKATQSRCAAPEPDRGAFATRPGGPVDPTVTARSVLALGYGTQPAVPAPSIAVTPLVCPGAEPGRALAAQGGAAWLIAKLKAGGNHFGGPSDFDATVAAVQALSATGHPAEAGAAVDWLASGAKTMAGSDPVRLASLILAAKATNRTVTTFGGLDLPKLLQATGPAATPTPDMTNQSNLIDGPADHTLRDTLAAVIAVLLAATLILGMRRSRRED